MQPYSKNIYFYICLSLPGSETYRKNTKIKLQRISQISSLSRDVKRYVSGHLHHAERSRSLRLTTRDWQRRCPKRRLSKNSSGFFFCMQRPDAPAILVHQRNDTAEETRSTQTGVKTRSEMKSIIQA